MAEYKCKMCGGTLRIEENQEVGVCEYCGTKQTLPLLNDEKRENLYNAASELRRNNEYDRALKVYENILEDDSTDAEAYWCLVLCKYGIEYVEDPITQKIVPTINRTHYTSVFADGDYKLAIKYASEEQKRIYEEQAREIDEIQKGILEISKKEEPFDVFICYKETDKNGRRTRDSVLATELYHELTEEGFKVFFSRITLEDKLGSEYEPYIFAALNSSKIMVVLGTSEENFKSVWVRNEWSRYLSLIKNGEEKVLIPAYRDMDPYDLPEEFSNLQAQDMSKLGFMQDLIRGIDKILGQEEDITSQKIILNENVSVDNLIKRIELFLEDKDFESASEYCERVLDMEPENAKAYLYRLLIEYGLSTLEELKECNEDFSLSSNYKRVMSFGDEDIKQELYSCVESNKYNMKKAENDVVYNACLRKIKYAQTIEDYQEIIDEIEQFSEFEYSLELLNRCHDGINKIIYDRALAEKGKKTVEGYKKTIEMLQQIKGWGNVDNEIEECKRKIEEFDKKRKSKDNNYEKVKNIQKKIAYILFPVMAVIIIVLFVHDMYINPEKDYKKAMEYVQMGDYDSALYYFELAGDYSDARYQHDKYYSMLKYEEAASYEKNKDYGKAAIYYKEAGDYKDAKRKQQECFSKVGVKKHTIDFIDNNIIAVKNDGTVFYNGDLFEYVENENNHNETNISEWRDIVSVSICDDFVVGLQSNGDVVLKHLSSYYDQSYDLREWNNIKEISSSSDYLVGLKADGTVMVLNDEDGLFSNVSNWTNIVDIDVSNNHIVGLKADGTVVACGDNSNGQCDVEYLNDIKSICVDDYSTVCVTKDNNVKVVGFSDYEEDIVNWKDIKEISISENHIIGLKLNGKVVAVGNNDYSQCDLQNWKNIEKVYAGKYYSLGIDEKGKIFVKGQEYDEIMELNDRDDIMIPKE